jgi:hypothetical protein
LTNLVVGVTSAIEIDATFPRYFYPDVCMFNVKELNNPNIEALVSPK